MKRAVVIRSNNIFNFGLLISLSQYQNMTSVTFQSDKKIFPTIQ
jgi:hypothetical protein